MAWYRRRSYLPRVSAVAASRGAFARAGCIGSSWCLRSRPPGSSSEGGGWLRSWLVRREGSSVRGQLGRSADDPDATMPILELLGRSAESRRAAELALGLAVRDRWSRGRVDPRRRGSRTAFGHPPAPQPHAPTRFGDDPEWHSGHDPGQDDRGPAPGLSGKRRLITPRELRRAIRQANVLGLPIEEEDRRKRERSDLEEDFLTLCERHRLPVPEVNVRDRRAPRRLPLARADARRRNRRLHLPPRPCRVRGRPRQGPVPPGSGIRRDAPRRQSDRTEPARIAAVLRPRLASLPSNGRESRQAAP